VYLLESLAADIHSSPSLAAQVVNLIRTKLQEHRSLETAVRDVTAEAISAGSVDNVSVVVLAFHQKLKQEAGRQP
jgi:serine/threonine protein phosphatase PrpC